MSSAADLLARTIALMRPSRTLLPIQAEFGHSQRDAPPPPALVPMPESGESLRNVAWWRFLMPVLVTGALTVLVVLVLRSLST